MSPISMQNAPLYCREPLRIHNGIPIFSERDGYVDNYVKIAADHVSQITESQENPFMGEELWVSLERRTREHIRKYVPKGQRILDVGVGLGRLLEPLTEYERYGVDISEDYLTIAKNRGIEVALSKIEELPYSHGYFDAIVVCDVLEHVFDLHQCCKRIIDCLRPGGVLVVRVPYKEDLEVYLSDDLPYEFIHMRSFDEAGLRLLFQKILGMQFLAASTSTPYLQGAPRLKLRLLKAEAKSKIESLAQKHAEFAEISGAYTVSEEELLTWIYKLQATSPDLFAAIADELIYGIEIDCVFRKPLTYSHVFSSSSDSCISAGSSPISDDLVTAYRELSSLRSELDSLKNRFDVDQAALRTDIHSAFEEHVRETHAISLVKALRSITGNSKFIGYLKAKIRSAT